MQNPEKLLCTKSEARIAALLRILAGCAARGGRIPAVVFDRRATKHPAKIRAALRVGAAPAPRRVAGSLNRTSAIRLASALRVIRRRSQRCYTSLRLGALGRSLSSDSAEPFGEAARRSLETCSAGRAGAHLPAPAERLDPVIVYCHTTDADHAMSGASASSGDSSSYARASSQPL